jgi:hypothetical protein
MPLLEICLPTNGETPPPDVRAFLREAARRIDRFQRDHHLPGFVPSDYTRTYGALQALAASGLAAGDLFCEWGSGFGVVACLASMLDFDACGIEIEGELVDAARELADDFDLSVEFVRGSFIPPGGGRCLAPDSAFGWLSTAIDRGHEDLGYGPDDFDVIFAYPWPDEERAVAALFERFAGPGALLLSYHSGDELRLRRKNKFSRGAARRR